MRIFVFACLVATSIASPALAQGKQDFTLVNKTGYTIDEVYVSPTNSDNWGNDVMGRDVLNANEYVNISFARKEKTCKWDLQVVYDDKETSEWEGFDLCKTSKIILYYNRKKGETWAEYE